MNTPVVRYGRKKQPPKALDVCFKTTDGDDVSLYQNMYKDLPWYSLSINGSFVGEIWFINQEWRWRLQPDKLITDTGDICALTERLDDAGARNYGNLK